MRVLFIACVLLIGNHYCAGQNTDALSNRVRAGNTIFNLTDNNGLSNGEVLYGLPVPPGEVRGDTYFAKEWADAEIKLAESGKVIKGIKARFNLDGHRLELMTSANEVRSADAKKISSFTLTYQGHQHYFVNSNLITIPNTPSENFLEVIAEGKYTLFKSNTLTVKEPTYREDLGVGDPDYKVEKRYQYYLSDGSSLQELNVQNSKKFLKAFGLKADGIRQFIRENHLSTKDDRHLRLIFEKLNAYPD